MTATEAPAYTLDVDPGLLDHTEHLPEVVECKCGFRRDAGPTLAE